MHSLGMACARELSSFFAVPGSLLQQTGAMLKLTRPFLWRIVSS